MFEFIRIFPIIIVWALKVVVNLKRKEGLWINTYVIIIYNRLGDDDEWNSF